jgi:hydrophobic/amphiphilic exporter-1 (mainly G- bacteria), HAE1 family
MLVQRIVSRPTTVIIIFALVVGFGIYTATDLAIDLYPDVVPPVLLLFTDYPGAGPEEVEKTVTRPLEGVLSNVANVEKIRSTSSEGTSQITIEFTWGTNMSEASNDVRDKLEFVKDYLPTEASTPQIFKFDPSTIPILFLVVRGTRTPEELKEIAEKNVVPRIEQVEGVALASVSGGRERAVMVEIPQNRLEAYNVTLTQISGMLRGQNVQISAGSIPEGSRDYLIRTSGEYKNIDEVKNTVIAYKAGTAEARTAAPEVHTIRLRDLANVYDGYRKLAQSVYINGQPGVYIIVQKQSGTNSVKTADNVLGRLPRINQGLPRGVTVEVVQDTTQFIRSSLTQLSSSALSGALLTVVILLFFFRSIKTTLVIGVTLPVSIVVTFMLMRFAGLTLNLMTITGLALGIGNIVDSSIVILDNSYRYREKGAKLTVATILGTQEMVMAITASILTSIVVFAPVAIFKSQLGYMGEMFASLSFTVVISLLASLVCAIFLIPVLASTYLPISSRKEDPLKGIWKTLDDMLARFFTGMDNAYKAGLRFVLRRRVLTVVVIGAFFVASIALSQLRGFQFMPDFQSDTIAVNVELPVGTKLEVTEAVLKQIEQVVKNEVKGYRNIIISAGDRAFFGFLGANQGHKGSLTISLPPFKNRIDGSDDVKAKLRKHFNDFPSAVFAFQQGGGISSSSPIDIIVRSNDLALGKQTAEKIRQLIKTEVPRATEPKVDIKDGLPQVEIFIDRDKAYDFGLNVTAIGQEIRANVDGVASSKYRVAGDEYDIVVILDPRDRDAIPDLNRIFVNNASGARIPLASFAHYERTSGPVSVNRENQARVAHVTAGIVPGTDLKSTETAIRRLIDREIPASESVVIEFSGDYANLQKYGLKLVVLLGIAIALVFGVMAAQFESFLDPFIIMFTLPLTIIGVVAVHILVGINYTMFTIVGFVVLAGIVVNNGIVLVDYTNLLRKRGRSIIEACVEAGGNRLRPVLLTTLTTVLGLLPLATDKGEGLDLIRPIGLAILGGSSVSFVFTLFLIPVLYAWFNEASDRRKARLEARKQRRLQARKAAAAALQEARS